MEAGSLSLVDVDQQTHVEAVQTPSHTGLTDHYVQIILRRISLLSRWSRYLVVDGYFMKKCFTIPVVEGGLQVITKMRTDADLKYLYTGAQKKGRGRKRKVADKVPLRRLEKHKWKKCHEDEAIRAYELVCWCVALKRMVKVVYLLSKSGDQYQILLSTDTQQAGSQIITYYRLRNQIEFLIRDAKQHAGLQHCQARSQEKL